LWDPKKAFDVSVVPLRLLVVIALAGDKTRAAEKGAINPERLSIQSWALLGQYMASPSSKLPNGSSIRILGMVDHPDYCDSWLDSNIRVEPPSSYHCHPMPAQCVAAKYGIATIDCIFSTAIGLSKAGELLVFANGDLIFSPAFIDSVATVRNRFTTSLEVRSSFAITKWSRGFAVVGQRTDLLDFDHLIPSSRILDSTSIDVLVKSAMREGVVHSDWGIDYIVIPPHIFPESFPPYLVGRWRWDNCLLLDLILSRVPTVDVTTTNPVIHLGGGTLKEGQLQRKGGQFNDDLAKKYYREALSLGRINNTEYMLTMPSFPGNAMARNSTRTSFSFSPRTTIQDQNLLLALQRSSTPRFHQLDAATGGLAVAYPFLLLVIVWKHQLAEAKTWTLVAERLLGDFKYYVFLAMDAAAYKTLAELYPDRVLKGEFRFTPSSNYLAVGSNIFKKLLRNNVDLKMLKVDDLLQRVDSDTKARVGLREPCDVTFAAGGDTLEVTGLRPTPAGMAFWALYQECFLSGHQNKHKSYKSDTTLTKCLIALKNDSRISSSCYSSIVEKKVSLEKEHHHLFSFFRSAAALEAPSPSSSSSKTPVDICTPPTKMEPLRASSSYAFQYSPARLDLFTQRVLQEERAVYDKLHLILVVYSPVRFAARFSLTKNFIRRIESRHAKYVELYIVELVYGDQNFMITSSDNPHHLQLRSSVPLWHKENLINLGVKRLLPPDWKAMAWVDAEVEFESPTWALDALKLLVVDGCRDSYRDVVQLFSHAVNTDTDGLSTAEEIATGFGYNYQRGLAYKGNGKGFWHPGFGWAMNRKAYDKVGGLFEYNILGAGDTVFARSMLGMFDATVPQTDYWGSEGHFRAVLEWQSKTDDLRVGYVPGVIRHHFHGSTKDRKYMDRLKILQSFVYDPGFHLVKNADSGVIAPSLNFPAEAIDTIIGYFEGRKEDGETFRVAPEIVQALPENSLTLPTLLEIGSQPIDDNDKLHLIVVVPPVSSAQLKQKRVRNGCNCRVNKDTPLFIQRMLGTHSASTKHIEVYVIEVVYDNNAFQITSPDNPHHLQLRTHVPLWHKENLINLGIKQLLPRDWKAMAWIDPEVEFESPTWSLDTLRLLLYGYKDVVQLFSHAMETETDGSAAEIFTGFAYNYERGLQYRGSGLDFWHPGFGWAWSRKAYDAAGGLYESSVFGGGPAAQALALAGFHSSPPAGAVFNYLTPAAREAILEYETRLRAQHLEVGFIPGVIRRGACHVDFPGFISFGGMVADAITIDTAKDFSVIQGHKGLIYEYATVTEAGTPPLWQKLPRVKDKKLYVPMDTNSPKIGARWMEPYITKDGEAVLVCRGWQSDIVGDVNVTGTIELKSQNVAGDGVNVYLEVDGERVSDVYTILPIESKRSVQISTRVDVQDGTTVRMVVDPRKSSKYDGVYAHFYIHVSERLVNFSRHQDLTRILRERNFDPRTDLLVSDSNGLLYPSRNIVDQVIAMFCDT